MILHLINKSISNSPALDECLSLLQAANKKSAILLLEDAVNAAISNQLNAELHAKINALDIPCYVLTEDLQARGLLDKIAKGFTQVDYAGFVQLSLEYKKVQSWA
tara:strand:- start:125 stop:439 length:315 start_codon:yes stop_codon:yes gene_type:complete